MHRYELRVTASKASVAAAIHDLLNSMTETGDTSPLATGSYGLRAIDDDSTEVLLLLTEDDDGLGGHALSNALRSVGLHVDEFTEPEKSAGGHLAADTLKLDTITTNAEPSVVEVETADQMAEAPGPEPEPELA